MEIKLEKVVKSYYEALAEGKVLGRKCPVCGNVEWPPVYACNACGSYVTEWYEMSKEGELFELYMPTTMSAKPAYKDLEPYAFGSIRTKDGPERDVMVLNITKQNEKWVRGHMPYPVHMQIVDRDGYKTCIFAIDPVDADGMPCENPERNNPFAEHPSTESGANCAHQDNAAHQANSETIQRLIALAAASYNIDPATLSAATSFQEDLQGPSVIFVGFIAKIEDEFDKFISVTDASAAKTIGGLASLIDGNIIDDSIPESSAVGSTNKELFIEMAPEVDPEILKRLIALAAASYNKDPATLSAATSFQEDLHGPSVIFVGFVAKLEDEFDVFVNITDASAAKTLGGLAELIGNRMND